MQSRTRLLLTTTLVFVLAGQAITATGQEIPVEMPTTNYVSSAEQQALSLYRQETRNCSVVRSICTSNVR